MAKNDLATRVALTDKEFFMEACRYCGATNVNTASKWWDAFNEVIIRHLYFDKSVRLPNIGTFTLREVGQSIQVHKGTDGREVIYRVPAKEVPIFTPHDNMIDDVNMSGVTKAYRRRLKLGNLTQRDYERQCRAEALNIDGRLPDKYVEASKERFAQILQDKKKKYKGKVRVDNDETEE